MSKQARRPARPGPKGSFHPTVQYTDLDALAGSWVDVPGFDDAIQVQDRVEEAL